MSKYDHNQVMLMFDFVDSAQALSTYLASAYYFPNVRSNILECIRDLTELSEKVHQVNVESTYAQRATQLEFQFHSESKKRAEDILLQSRLTGNKKILHCDDLPPRQDQSITLWKRPVYLYWPTDPRAGFGFGVQVFDSCRNL